MSTTSFDNWSKIVSLNHMTQIWTLSQQMDTDEMSQSLTAPGVLFCSWPRPLIFVERGKQKWIICVLHLMLKQLVHWQKYNQQQFWHLINCNFLKQKLQTCIDSGTSNVNVCYFFVIMKFNRFRFFLGLWAKPRILKMSCWAIRANRPTRCTWINE